MKQTHQENKHTSYSSDELIGRALLKEILPKLYNRNKYDLAYYLSDIADTTHYDAFVSIFNKETGSHIACHIIEVKVRDTFYTELMYEKYKHQQLKNALKRNYNVADIIYINVTPNGTYVFNTTKLENENLLNWEKRECNKSTVDYYNTNNKITKEKQVAFLPVSKAIKHYPTITNSYLDKVLKAEKKEVVETVKAKQREKCLYQWLFTPSDLKGEIKKNDE